MTPFSGTIDAVPGPSPRRSAFPIGENQAYIQYLRRPLSGMGLESVMTTDVVTVDLDDTVMEVAEVFRERDVGSAVVLNADGEVSGIVTDRDLVVFGQEFVETLERTVVNQILSPVVFTVSPDTDTHELTRMMRDEGVRRVPVVEDGDLHGIVTLDDLVVQLADDLSNLATLIQSESPSQLIVD